MSYDITVIREAQRIRVAVRGRIGIGQLHSLLEVLQVESVEWPGGEVLFDLRGLEGCFGEPERAGLKGDAVRRLGRDVRFEWE